MNNLYSQDYRISETKFIKQLYLFDDKAGLTGAINFTEKGNVIFHCIDFEGDTVRYLFGTYSISETKITYQLTDEYYYYGKWDAKWNVENPDYIKGKCRKIKTQLATLYKSKTEKNNYSRPYSSLERTAAFKKHPESKLSEFTIFPYNETPNMQFYSWFFKQVPVLANL